MKVRPVLYSLTVPAKTEHRINGGVSKMAGSNTQTAQKSGARKPASAVQQKSQASKQEQAKGKLMKVNSMVLAVVDVAEQGTGKEKQRTFRLVAARMSANNKYEYKKFVQTEEQLTASVKSGKMNIINVCLDDKGKIKGRTGDLSRFNNGKNKPIVILVEMDDEKGKTIGYRVATSTGSVEAMPLKKMMQHCATVTAGGGIPVQNGMYVAGAKDPKTGSVKDAHIRSYPNGEYAYEIYKREVKAYSAPAKINEEKNKKALDRINELFTPPQIAELKRGKAAGMNIKRLGNPKISAEAMHQLVDMHNVGMKTGSSSWENFCSPDYKVECLQLIKTEFKNGNRVEPMMNPKYNFEQLGVIAMANEDAINIKLIGGPEVKADEMQERLLRLQSDLWKKEEVAGIPGEQALDILTKEVGA